MQSGNKALVRNRCPGWRKEKGRNTSRLKHDNEETPWERTCLQVLLAGTPVVPSRGQKWRGDTTVRRSRRWLSEGRLTMIDGAVLCSH